MLTVKEVLSRSVRAAEATSTLIKVRISPFLDKQYPAWKVSTVIQYSLGFDVHLGWRNAVNVPVSSQ
jgi:hypothetical protein